MKEIILTEDEIKEIMVNAMKEKVANHYSYKIVEELVTRVMNEPESQKKLEKFVRSALSFLQNDKVFEKSVVEEFQRKVAKSLVGKLEGTVEKAVDKLRQNEVLRAQMILAIEGIINKAS